MNAWWNGLEWRAKLGLALGSATIVLAAALSGWWLLRGERAVLFSGLKPQDAATLAAELDKQKVPYSVADDGATLLVDKSLVHATRLKLMGRELPLHGAVGLELFNNTDFGMTEFAQKINYQRALQGELTRTILSFSEVADARVHLALPEQGLFKQAATQPKAAITLTLRRGQALRPEQVSGIRRLAAAAVPGLAAQEVTVVDQQGVAISRPTGDGEGEAGGSGRLGLKRETEDYLSRKAGVVLERAFGPGQALASVDVTLNMDQVRVTTEDVIGAPQARGGAAAGVLVRERESMRDHPAAEGRGPEARGSATQREVEYQAGRRVEQVVSQPGSIRRIHVVAVVRQALDANRQDQVRQLVATAVGAMPERGDAVLVQSFEGVLPHETESAAVLPPAGAPGAGAAIAAGGFGFNGSVGQVLAVLGGGLLAAATLALLTRAARKRLGPAPPAELTDGQRRLALRRVEAWLQQEPLRGGLAAQEGAPR